jgi:NAD(P)-dependent dehydrogenase (short-subunit alcohol dehydrogenase family)
VDGDISKKETAVNVVDAALTHFGRIDLLVNNAGIFIPKAFTDYTKEDYNLVMNTNVASFFYMTQQVTVFYARSETLDFTDRVVTSSAIQDCIEGS